MIAAGGGFAGCGVLSTQSVKRARQAHRLGRQLLLTSRVVSTGMEKFELRLDHGQALLDGLLKSGVALNHACRGTLACGTCWVVVRDGFELLSPAGEEEQDMLAKTAMADPHARLACQAISVGGDVAIEVPDSEILRSNGPVLDTALPIALSKPAAKHLAVQLTKRSDSVAVRVAVEPAGCAGLRYRFELAEAIRADDMVFESDGIRIAVDPTSLPYLQGATLDLVQEGLGRRLRLQNPKARQTCGCGESFAV